MYDVILALSEQFSCNQCGKCCITPWRVKVDPDRAERLSRAEATAEVLRAGYQPLRLVEDRIEVGRRQDGSCVFLTAEGCSVHRESGPFAKPSVCQLYPLSVVNSPDGYYLSLVFSCPSVVQGGGRDLSAQLDDMRETLERSEFYDGQRVDRTEVALTERRAMSWREWCRLEPTVSAILEEFGPVKGGVRLVASLMSYIRLEETEWDPRRLEREDLKMVAERFPVYAAATVALLEGASEHSGQMRVAYDLLAGEVIPSRLLGGELPTFVLRGPLDERTEQTLIRFVSNYVLGKRILLDGSVMSRLLALSVSVAVLHLYHENKTESTEPGGLAWCFDIIETALLGHSDTAMNLFREFESQLLTGR